LSIGSWGPGEKRWKQESAGPVEYAVNSLTPGTVYTIVADGKPVSRLNADANGVLRFHGPAGTSKFQLK